MYNSSLLEVTYRRRNEKLTLVIKILKSGFAILLETIFSQRVIKPVKFSFLHDT